MTRKNILLIHQEPNMQEVVQACLSDLGGWEVRGVDSTVEGLQQAQIHQPDAIILEVSLGEMDGLSFLRQLKTEPTTREIPVILLLFSRKGVDLQPTWLGEYVETTVIADPFNPAMLPIEIAHILGWQIMDNG